MPATPDVTALAWLTGTWRGTVDGDPVEEIWGAPLGPSLAGVFRWLVDGEVYLYEILAVEPDADGLVLRLRHFGRGLVPSEGEGPATPSWRLARLADREAVFEHESLAFPRRMVYHRPDEQTLVVRLEGTRGSSPASMEFRFARA